MMTNPDVHNKALQEAIQAHRKGDLLRAKGLYETLLLENPTRPDIAYNLGLLLMAQQQLEQATTCFKQVCTQVPHHVSANYHLANGYFSLERFTEAQSHYEKVLTLQPDHIDALSNLGALLLHEKKEEQALQCFSTVIAINPHHKEARHNLATTLLQLERYFHACEHFRWLLEQSPKDIGARYSYGLALLDCGETASAISQLQHVLALKPDHILAQSNLGIAYMKDNQPELAKQAFEGVLEKQPHNTDIAYLYAALTQKEAPLKAPTTYLKDLFNHYANHYEPHLRDTLHYQVPQQLYALLQKHILPHPHPSWHILDLGCGSGLCGLIFKSIAKQLDGVDLSNKMLTLAKNKSLYQHLYEDDLLNLLSKTSQAYDLLVAADTFNYFGDFSILFTACRLALKPESYLLFSVETSNESTPWQLQTNARYAHNKTYIENCAQKYQFDIIDMQTTILRQQAKQPVAGWLCLLKVRS